MTCSTNAQRQDDSSSVVEPTLNLGSVLRLRSWVQALFVSQVAAGFVILGAELETTPDSKNRHSAAIDNGLSRRNWT